MKLKLDENLSRHLKEILQQEAHDGVTTADEELLGKSDLEVGAAVKQEGRILFTLDLEFADLRKYPPGSHPGVILFRPRTMGPLSVNHFILQFVREADLSKFACCAVVADQDRVRVRRPALDDE